MIAFSAYAESIQPYYNNIDNVGTSFSISSSGRATVNNSYSGITGTTKSVTIKTKIQKKVGIIWVTVSGGSWRDTSTATNYSKKRIRNMLFLEINSKQTIIFLLKKKRENCGITDINIT